MCGFVCHWAHHCFGAVRRQGGERRFLLAANGGCPGSLPRVMDGREAGFISVRKQASFSATRIHRLLLVPP